MQTVSTPGHQLLWKLQQRNKMISKIVFLTLLAASVKGMSLDRQGRQGKLTLGLKFHSVELGLLFVVDRKTLGIINSNSSNISNKLMQISPTHGNNRMFLQYPNEMQKVFSNYKH